MSRIIKGQMSYAILFLAGVMFHMEHLVFKKCILLIINGDSVKFMNAKWNVCLCSKILMQTHSSSNGVCMLTGKGGFIASSPR